MIYGIRETVVKDCIPIFLLRNEPVVRDNSISTNRINEAEHTRWFTGALSNAAFQFYTIVDEAGGFSGYIRYNAIKATAIVSLALIRECRGKGVAKNLLNVSLKRIKNKLDIMSVTAVVRIDNIASCKLFLSCGFHFSLSKKISGIQYNEYVYAFK